MSCELITNAYGSGSGVIITSERRRPLGELDRNDVLHRLPSPGFILFRGFDADVESFSQLVRRSSARVTLDPARSFGGEGGIAQKVDAGLDAVGLHCENGNSPFMPDLCWFFCEKAATSGSQTTVCDGYRVWNELCQSTQQTFRDQDIVYSRSVEEAKWKRLVFHLLDREKPMSDITIQDLISQTANDDRTRVIAKADGSIHYSFRTPAVHRTLFDTRLAFSCSILGPSYNYEKPVIAFADGTPISTAILGEVASVTEALTEDINWADGDVLVIDNTRVMHGRRAILDPARVVYNALSYLA